ncbi:zinc ABC transporter substrate-binding protein [Leucobacter sp. OAMLP11]|uniref:ABC transporter substrate-binding protein n=1 Tax=unclassified Leucobacter TaxID=2621730 RepID=UPI000C191D0C|nr:MULTISPECIES: ABC transporter substrate-binding protein [unclassified Leucobacter]PIO50704.1 zinc ABC transporter substrate-binding protein [Leucobacter sp. OAMLP11]
MHQRITTPRSRAVRARIPLAVSASVLALALVGCGTAVANDRPQASTDAGPVSLENCGRDITVPSTPKAVVGLHPSQTELLLRLGVADRMVGQAQTTSLALPDDVAKLATKIPVIGEASPPSREDLLAAAPDFVYSPTTYEFTAEKGFASIDQLTAAGATAYVATGGCFDRRMTGTVDDLFVDLQNLGRIFRAEDAAARLTDRAKQDLAEVRRTIDGEPKPKAAQVYVDGTSLSAIGAGVEHDIMRLAGAENLYGPKDPAFADFFAAQITPEALAAKRPDALVFAVTDDAHERATRDYLRKTFPDMPAVKNDRLISIPFSDTFPGTLGNIDAVQRIAAGLYPQKFSGQ